MLTAEEVRKIRQMQEQAGTSGTTAATNAAAGSKLNDAFDKLANSKLGGFAKEGYNNVTTGAGLIPKAAPWVRKGMVAYDVISALKGISDYQRNRGDTQDMINKILTSANSNGNWRYDLSQDQLNTLRQLQNGSFDKGADFEASDLLSNIGGTVTGALSGAIMGGGIPGALLGAAGGLIKGVSNSVNNRQQLKTSQLQDLYSTLYDSEMRTKQMRGDAANQRFMRSIYA